MKGKGRGRAATLPPLPSPAWVIRRPWYDGPRPHDGLDEEWVVRVYCLGGDSLYYRPRVHLHEWLRVLIRTPALGHRIEAGHFVANEWQGSLVVAWPESWGKESVLPYLSIPATAAVRPLEPDPDLSSIRKGVWS